MCAIRENANVIFWKVSDYTQKLKPGLSYRGEIARRSLNA